MRTLHQILSENFYVTILAFHSSEPFSTFPTLKLMQLSSLANIFVLLKIVLTCIIFKIYYLYKYGYILCIIHLFHITSMYFATF